jgi:hypothetical protein
LLGHCAGFSGGDGVGFDGDDGENLHDNVGEEDFVGGQKVVDGERFFADGDVVLSGDFDDGFSGDAGQDGGVQRRRIERAVLYEEDIADAAFGERVFGGKPQGLGGEPGVGVAEGDQARAVAGGFVAGKWIFGVLAEVGQDDADAFIVIVFGVRVNAAAVMSRLEDGAPSG